MNSAEDDSGTGARRLPVGNLRDEWRGEHTSSIHTAIPDAGKMPGVDGDGVKGGTPLGAPYARSPNESYSRHGEAARRRRDERRNLVSPYVSRQRADGNKQAQEKREGPTAGETQVLMSLWRL